MFDVEKIIKEKGFNEETYEKMLDELQAKTHRETDIDWSELSEKYNLKWSGDAIRKASQIPLIGGTFVKEYYEQKIAKNSCNNEDDYIKKLEEKKREIERLKVQYRDERNAWSKQNYSAARVDETLNLLENELKKIGKINFESHSTPIINGDNEMIICLSDLHIGQTFKSVFGEYDSGIAEIRLNKYLNKIKEISLLHNIRKVHVVSLGDQISGQIHKTVAITNKENVIEQIKLSVKYISSFCYELTKLFESVQFSNVSGNHSRIDRKEDALHDERLDDLIGWCVDLSLKHISNFHYMKYRNIDVGIADLSVCGKFYIAVHGDYDSMSKQGISNLCMFLGFTPEAIIKGHMHSPALSEFNGVKMIQSGSLAGSGDQYTIEKRLCGKPSQTLLVCNKDGIECIYNVCLK